MLCASQKGTTIRHKYFGTLDLVHDFTDKETSPYGLGFNRSSRTSERQFLFNGMVCFARAEDQKWTGVLSVKLVGDGFHLMHSIKLQKGICDF